MTAFYAGGILAVSGNLLQRGFHMKKIAAIGDNCIDLYDNTGRFHVTGNALDFAVNMRRLGLPTSLISTTGNDFFGHETIRVLESENIDISQLKQVDGKTAVSHMKLIGKERTYGEYEEGVLENMSFSKDDIWFAGNHDLVHSAFWGNATEHLEEIKSYGPIISFDYATEFEDSLVEETIKFVDYGFFSFEERNSDVENFLKEQVSLGAKVAIGTLGEQGSIAWDGNSWHEFGIINSPKLENTVGAGDSYIAGFMYGILNNMSINDAQQTGAKVASNVVSVFEPWTDYKGEIFI